MRPIVTIVALSAGIAGCPGNGPNGRFPWEEGCILVDGQGGWAFLSDALTQAEDGSTIRLCGPIRDTIVIDRDITIVTDDPLTLPEWRAPENEPAIRVVDGGSLTMRGVFISTTRNGITVEEGGTADLARVWIRVDDPGSYGIEIDGGHVSARNLIVEDAYWGGIQNTGGTLELVSSDIVNSLRWGVRLEDGATATIEDTLIGGTFISDETGANNDGWALFVGDGCEATLTDVDLESNVLGGAFVERGTLTATGGTWANNFIAGWFDDGTVTLTDVEVLDPLQYGFVSLTSRVTLTDVTVDADPENSPFEDPTTNNLEGGYGAVVFDGDLTWTGGVVREFNGGGIYASGNASAQLPMRLTEVSIEDNAALGIQIALTDLTATDLKVTGTVNADDICVPDGFTYGCNWGVGAFQSDVDWVGGAIRDNGAIGMLVSDGPTDLSLVEIADNETFGVWTIAGVLQLDRSEVAGTGQVGLQVDGGSFVTVTDTTFHDRDHVESFAFDETEYRFFYGATDIAANDATLTVQGSRFQDGQAAIAAFSSEVTVEDTTFDGYLRTGVRVSGGTGNLDRVHFANFGGDVVVCQFGGDLSLQRATIAGVTEIPTRTEIWTNGVLTDTDEGSYTAPAVRATGCTVDLSRVDVDGIRYQAMSFVDSAIGEFDRVTVARTHTGLVAGSPPEPAIAISWTEGNRPELYATALTVADVRHGTALRLLDASGVSDGEVVLEGLSIGDVAGIGGDGVAISGVTGLSLTGLEIAGTAGTGLVLQGTTGVVTGVDPDGDYPGTIVSSGGGVRLEDSPVTLAALTIDASGDGIATTGADPTFDGVDVTSAAGFGIACAASTPTCQDTTASGALGATDGCGTCAD